MDPTVLDDQPIDLVAAEPELQPLNDQLNLSSMSSFGTASSFSCPASSAASTSSASSAG